MKITFYKCCVQVIILLAPFFSNAQNDPIQLQGQVIDKITSEPLVYATIAIRDSQTGTVTNSNGEFTIVVKNPETNDSLTVSMLGYESKSFSIAFVNTEKEFIIELKEKVFQLDEVTITGKKPTGEDYLASALKNHKNNLPANAYVLSIFFRETTKLNEKYFSLLEAAGCIKGEKQNRGSLDINIEEIRFALGKYPNVPVRVGKSYNPFRELDASMIFNKRLSPCQDCKYEIEEYSTFQDHSIVVISSYKNPKNASAGYMKFYIDLEDYGIWRFEFEAEIPFGTGFPEVLENGVNSSLVFLSRRIDYKKVEGKYYLHQYHQNAKHQYEKHSDSETYFTEHFFNLLVNDIGTSGCKSSKSENRMDYKHSLSTHVKNYNPDFWKTYNIIRQSPLDKKIISDLKSSSEKKDIFD